MDKIKLAEVLRLHALYLAGDDAGVMANLYGADLSMADLRGANLGGAYLRGADLSRADLRRAYLSGADLSMANLSMANLLRADLSMANLSGAYLSNADLSRAELIGATLPYPIYQAFLGKYHIHTNKEYIRIGCNYLTVSEWLLVTEKQALEMGLDSRYYSGYMNFIQWYSKQCANGQEGYSI